MKAKYTNAPTKRQLALITYLSGGELLDEPSTRAGASALISELEKELDDNPEYSMPEDFDAEH